MRDNLMVNLPPNSLSGNAAAATPMSAGVPGSALLASYEDELGLPKSLLLSLGVHFGIIFLFWVILVILPFLGINLLTFDRPQPLHDIEFQLINSPNETPRNPHTRNRAEHNSRAGGEKIPHVRDAQPMQQAGAPAPKPIPRPQAQQRPSRTQPTHQPQRPSQQPPRPQPKMVAPSPSHEPAPPKPRVTAPKMSTARPRFHTVPNPLSPIRAPEAPGPIAAETGPVVRGPSGSPSGSRGGSSVAPATLPGQFSSGGFSGGRASPSGGRGGRGNYSQFGSPGGGGGRAGIDATAEPDFGPYLAELQRRIRRNWQPPEDKQDKTVILLFTIARDGRLLNVSVKRSSGYGNADSAARQAVERSAPFRPLPAEFRNKSINVEFTFDYNVYTGRSGGISQQ